jgi:hypothetical protein
VKLLQAALTSQAALQSDTVEYVSPDPTPPPSSAASFPNDCQHVAAVVVVVVVV